MLLIEKIPRRVSPSMACGLQMNRDEERDNVAQDGRRKKQSIHGFASALRSVAAIVSPAAGTSVRMERETASKMLATSMMEKPVVRSALLILREKFGNTMESDVIDSEFRSEYTAVTNLSCLVIT